MGLLTYQLMRRREAARKAKEAAEHEQPEGSAGGGQEGGTGGAGSEGGANGAGGTGNAGDGQAGAGNDAGAGGQSPGNEAGQGNVPNSPAVTPEKLTAEQYTEVMRNKGNVMAELKRLGVEFSDRAGADDLRDVLNKALSDKGLLPDGN